MQLILLMAAASSTSIRQQVHTDAEHEHDLTVTQRSAAQS